MSQWRIVFQIEWNNEHLLFREDSQMVQVWVQENSASGNGSLYLGDLKAGTSVVLFMSKNFTSGPETLHLFKQQWLNHGRDRGPRKYTCDLVRWSATQSTWRQSHQASRLKARTVGHKKKKKKKSYPRNDQ